MLAALLAFSPALAVDATAASAGFAGEVLVARGGAVLLDRGYGAIDPSGGAPHRAGERWRLASITKQITATLVMQDAAAGRLPLDSPLAFPGAQPFTITPRRLLTHHSGLANPDATPAAGNGFPGFYLKPAPDLAYCTSQAPPPAATDFSYNNCDYILLGEAIAKRGGGALAKRRPAGTAMARSGEKGVPGFVAGKPEPRFDLASFGAAGGLVGTARAVFAFDRGLMTGRTLPPTAREAMWTPEGHGSYQALGQWVFPGQLRGCAGPKRIVQRDGEIGGVQARNFIFPDDDLVVILFTNRSSDDFRLSEVWEGRGFVYDLLSAAACG